ncbi:MAG: hypothetical protein AB1420_05805 [Bacillota bacterium]
MDKYKPLILKAGKGAVIKFYKAEFTYEELRNLQRKLDTELWDS